MRLRFDSGSGLFSLAAIFYGGITHNASLSSLDPASLSHARLSPRTTSVVYPSLFTSDLATWTGPQEGSGSSIQARIRLVCHAPPSLLIVTAKRIEQRILGAPPVGTVPGTIPAASNGI